MRWNRVRHVIKDMGVEFLIVDSVAAACGGEPEAAESANRFFLALRSLGLGSLLIAHTTKSGTEDAPFGSVFWRNNARSVWLVKKEQEIDQSTLKIALFNKKANSDRLQAPVAFGVGYGSQRTTIVRLGQADLSTDLAKAGGVSFSYRMRVALSAGPKDYATLAEELDSTPDVVGKTARRGSEAGAYTITRDGNRTVVGLRARTVLPPGEPTDTGHPLKGGVSVRLSVLVFGQLSGVSADKCPSPIPSACPRPWQTGRLTVA